MNIITPYTIVWVVKNENKLKSFMGPFFVKSAVTSFINTDYRIRTSYTLYSSNCEKEIIEDQSSMFTSFEEAINKFKELDFSDTSVIKKRISELSVKAKDDICKAQKEDREEKNRFSTVRDLVIE